MLQLAAATISACHNYSSGVRNASRDKKKIIDQLFGLQKVLDDVRDLLEDAEANAPSRLPALRELFNKPDGLPRCRAELETLKAKLETRPGRRDRVQALVWPLKEGEVKKTLDYIGQFQQLLSSTLNVDHMHVAFFHHFSTVPDIILIDTWRWTHKSVSKPCKRKLLPQNLVCAMLP